MKRFALAALITLALVVLGAVGLTAAQATSEPCHHQDGGVALPSAQTSPEDVVKTFVAALNVGDWSDVRLMLTPAQQVGLSDSQFLKPSYYGNICAVRGLRISSVTSQKPATVNGGQGYGQARFLTATYDVVVKDPERGEYGGDMSAFVLVRNTDSEPWLVAFMGPDV